jgi:hypothetical protein
MSEMTKYEPADLPALVKYAQWMMEASLLPKHIRTPQDVVLIVQFGHDYGMTPQQAIQNLYVVEGKVTMPANIAIGRAMGHGACEYLMCVETTTTQATWEGKRKGYPSPSRLTYTIEQARDAKLTGKQNWQKHPAEMLRARAGMQLVRVLFPDILAGIYDPDELGADRQPEPLPATVESQIHRAPQAAAPREEFEDAQLVEDSEPASNSPEDIAGDAAAPKDWSEDEQWKRAQKFYRVLISEGDVLDRAELEQVHIYTRRIMGVTSSRHIDPARFKKLNSQIAAVPVEDRAEWLRGKIAEMHPNPVDAPVERPATHTAA